MPKKNDIGSYFESFVEQIQTFAHWREFEGRAADLAGKVRATAELYRELPGVQFQIFKLFAAGTLTADFLVQSEQASNKLKQVRELLVIAEVKWQPFIDSWTKEIASADLNRLERLLVDGERLRKEISRADKIQAEFAELQQKWQTLGLNDGKALPEEARDDFAAILGEFVERQRDASPTEVAGLSQELAQLQSKISELERLATQHQQNRRDAAKKWVKHVLSTSLLAALSLGVLIPGLFFSTFRWMVPVATVTVFVAICVNLIMDGAITREDLEIDNLMFLVGLFGFWAGVGFALLGIINALVTYKGGHFIPLWLHPLLPTDYQRGGERPILAVLTHVLCYWWAGIAVALCVGTIAHGKRPLEAE